MPIWAVQVVAFFSEKGLPFLKQNWKFLVGAIVGVLVVLWLRPCNVTTIERTTETETKKIEDGKKETNAGSIEESVEEKFDNAGKITDRKTTKKKAEVKIVEVARVETKIVEKIVEKEKIVTVSRPREIGVGVDWVPSTNGVGLYANAEAFRFESFAVEAGIGVPVRPDFNGFDLERASVKAGFRLPLPF